MTLSGRKRREVDLGCLPVKTIGIAFERLLMAGLNHDSAIGRSGYSRRTAQSARQFLFLGLFSPLCNLDNSTYRQKRFSHAEKPLDGNLCIGKQIAKLLHV
jgi:hypothetical protein